MAGLKCTTPGCGMAMPVPEADIPKLRFPSAEITCPKCHRKQPAAECWIAYEQMEAMLRESPPKAFGFGRLTP